MEAPATAGFPEAVATGVFMGIMTTFVGFSAESHEVLAWTAISVVWIVAFLVYGTPPSPVLGLAKRMGLAGVFTGAIKVANFDTFLLSNPQYAEDLTVMKGDLMQQILTLVGGGVAIGVVWGALTGLILAGLQKMLGTKRKTE